jgi:ADYC domain-containing protein
MRAFRLASLAFALVGCVEPTDETTVTQAVNGCGPFLCGNNSPHAGELSFYELAVDGTPAEENGFAITSFKDKDGKPMKLDVQGFNLVGRRPDDTLWQGPILKDSTIVIANGSTSFEITIESVSMKQTYYQFGDDGTTIPSYEMLIVQLGPGGLPVAGNLPVHLCEIPHGHDPMWQSGMYDTLIYRGDRYDSHTGQIYATGDDAGRWFNIACAGDDLAKILITRFAEAATKAPRFVTSPVERTAMIQMFRADYCGTATPLTTLGVALDWENVGGWNKLSAPLTAANIEAIWTGTGAAVCLTNPRNPDVKLPCKKPPDCTKDQILNWSKYGSLVSRKP